jgi:hypothetical protein
MAQQRRLAIASRSGDEGELAVEARVQPLDQARTQHQLWSAGVVWTLASLLAYHKLHDADYIISRINGQPQPMHDTMIPASCCRACLTREIFQVKLLNVP